MIAKERIPYQVAHAVNHITKPELKMLDVWSAVLVKLVAGEFDLLTPKRATRRLRKIIDCIKKLLDVTPREVGFAFYLHDGRW
jgi:hypothetical protein